MALSLEGKYDEAIALTDDLFTAADTTGNPFSRSQLLLAAGLALRYADPQRALDALQRALEIAQASGNRLNESHIAVTLAPLAAEHGSAGAALDHLALAIRNYLETGNIATSRSPLANLAGVLCQLGHYEPAAIIADFADDPLTRIAFWNICHDRSSARGARRRPLRDSCASRPGNDQRIDGELRLRTDRSGSRAAQFPATADLSTSSGRPPRSRARR